jgi:hypothetical protein
VAVSAIVVAGAAVVVVAPADDVAGVIVARALDIDIARSPGPPAAAILVADQTDLVDVGDFGGADRQRVEGAAEAADASSAAPNAPSAMAFMEFSFRSGETIDLSDAAFRNSTLVSNIELFHGFPECWPCGRSRSVRSKPIRQPGITIIESNRFIEGGLAPEVSQRKLWITSRNTRGQQITSALPSKGDLNETC